MSWWQKLNFFLETPTFLQYIITGVQFTTGWYMGLVCYMAGAVHVLGGGGTYGTYRVNPQRIRM